VGGENELFHGEGGKNTDDEILKLRGLVQGFPKEGRPYFHWEKLPVAMAFIFWQSEFAGHLERALIRRTSALSRRPAFHFKYRR
jgi:hypothetical protein